MFCLPAIAAQKFRRWQERTGTLGGVRSFVRFFSIRSLFISNDHWNVTSIWKSLLLPWRYVESLLWRMNSNALKSNWPSAFPDVQGGRDFFLKAPFQRTASQQRGSEHMEKAPSVWPSAGRDLYLRFVQCVSYIETSAKYTKQNHIFGFSETNCSPWHSKRMQATEKGRQKKGMHPK